MQYLLMCCIEEERWNDIPQTQRVAVMREYGEWVQTHTTSGHYRGGAKLRSSSCATTVRETNGKAVMTDGPFAETKEQLGGYHVLECGDLDEALSIARRIPTLKVGGAIEVRPIEAQAGRYIPVDGSAARTPDYRLSER
jgi:hypothetical protein